MASRIVVEEFARLAEEGYDPRRGAEVVAETLAACHAGSPSTPRSSRGAPAATSRPARPPWSPSWSRTTRRPSGCWPTSATPGSTARRRRARAGQRRPQPGPGARRRRRDHPRGDGHPPRAARRHPRARRARPRAADYFLLPLPRAERLVLCSDGITEMIDDDAVAAILPRTHRPARRRRPAGRRGGAGRWSRQRHGRRGRCDGIGDRECLRLRAAARESRAEVGSPAVTSGDRERRRPVLPTRRLVRHLRRAGHRGAAAVGEGPGGRASGRWSTTAPASTRSSTR